MEGVIKAASKLMFHSGSRLVSMEELARAAGITRKVLYDSYPAKNLIIRDVVQHLIENQRIRLTACFTLAMDPVESVVLEYRYLREELAVINPVFFLELEKFYPDLWKQLQQQRDEVLAPLIKKNLQQGINGGWYRRNLDLDFIVRLRLEQIGQALGFFRTSTGFDNRYLLQQYTAFYLHGICTEKGKSVIENYLDE